MRASTGLLVGLLLGLAFGAVGCSGDEAPTRPVTLGNRLDMVIADAWELEGGDARSLVFVHRELGEVRLHIAAHEEEFPGGPLTVQSVKSTLGRDLNLQYGGVVSRISMGGNAMIRYARDVTDEYDDTLRSEEWVLARPAGYQQIARIQISLQMPPEAAGDPRVAEIVEALDRRVGDAKIPAV